VLNSARQDVCRVFGTSGYTGITRWAFEVLTWGNSLEEMKEIYERLRDKEFSIHVCAEYPRAEKAKG
jgi:hypothetical protein